MGKASVGFPAPPGGVVPAGGVIMWTGALNTIPKGWTLCDGQNGTPDLRNRFVVGAGSSYSLGATGGEAEHTLTVSEMPSHSHGIRQNQQAAGPNGDGYLLGTPRYTSGVPTDTVGSSRAHENRPPYYALYYIMKT